MTDPTPRTAATARERDVERVLAEALHIPEWPCDHRQYDPPQCVRAARSILAGSPTLPAALAAAEAPGRVAALEAAFRITRDELMDWEHHEDCEVWQHYDREPSAAEGPCDCSLAGLVNRLTLAIGENDRG